VKAGELFIAIGLKGQEKTQKALTDTNISLKEISTSALAAKAGILAALYGLEQMASKSGQTGLNFMRFAENTGLSTKMLQQWVYAGRQAGATMEEVQSSVTGVQTAFTNMVKLGKGQPEGLGFFMKALKDQDESFDMKNAMDKTTGAFYILERIQKALPKLPPDLSKQLIQSFGVNEGMLSALHQNVFTPNILNRAPVLSDRQLENMRKVHVGFSNVFAQAQTGMDKLVAKHGPQIVADLQKITPQVLALVESLLKLSESLKVFDAIKLAFEGWTEILSYLKEISDSIGGKHDMEGPKQTQATKARQMGVLQDSKWFEEQAARASENMHLNMVHPVLKNPGRAENPPVVNNNANVVVNNHGVKDAQEGAHHFKKAVQDVGRQRFRGKVN